MARTKVEKPAAVAVASWQDADQTLAEIGVHTAVMRKDLAALNAAHAEKLEALAAKHAPLSVRVKALELGLEAFCVDEYNKGNFDKGLKSRKLTAGTVSMRTGTPKVVVGKGFTFKACVELLKSAAANIASRFLRMAEPELNRDAVIENTRRWTEFWSNIPDEKRAETTPPADLFDPGMLKQVYKIEVLQEETFGYELNEAA